MKLFFLAPVDLTEESAPAVHVRSIVEEWAEQGQEVHLFSGSARRPFPGKIQFVSIRHSLRPGWLTLTYALWCWPVFLYWLVRARPNVVYARYFRHLLPFVLTSRLLGVPFVLEVNSDSSRDLAAYKRKPFRRSAEDVLEGLTCRLCDGIVAVSEGLRRSLVRRFKLGETKVTAISNGVDCHVFRPRHHTECRKELGLPQTGHYVVFVGTFQPWQGLEELLEAASIVLRSVSDTTFILVGDGPLRPLLLESCKALNLEGNVLFPGWVDNNTAARYIGAGDVSVAPYVVTRSTDEDHGPRSLGGSPLKIYSYLACGRPVVASLYQEAGSFVEAVGAGIAVSPGNRVALAEALVSLLKDPLLAHRLGMKGREIVVKEHSWAHVARKISAFCAEFGEQHRSTSKQESEL